MTGHVTLLNSNISETSTWLLYTYFFIFVAERRFPRIFENYRQINKTQTYIYITMKELLVSNSHV